MDNLIITFIHSVKRLDFKTFLELLKVFLPSHFLYIFVLYA